MIYKEAPKFMKKTISVILILALLFSVMILPAKADETAKQYPTVVFILRSVS